MWPFRSDARQTSSRRGRTGQASVLALLLCGGVALAMVGFATTSGLTSAPAAVTAGPTPSGESKPLSDVHSAEDVSAEDVRTMLNTYCVMCHNQGMMTGDLALDTIDVTDPSANAGTFEKVVTKLRAGAMPPGGIPRPEPETYDAVTNWLENELDEAWAADPEPGRAPAVHRLNRTEYNNAVNELLGLDVDVKERLPGDPTADGSFDNMAASLQFSTAHLDRYMTVAREVTRLAVGLPPVNAEVETYEVPLHVVQDWRQGEDLPHGSRGGIAVRHHFPVDGEYRIRVRLRANWQDYIMGMGWEQHLEVRLDGKLLQQYTVGGEAPGRPSPMSFSGPGEPGDPEWEEYMLTGDDRLVFEVPVEAGPHVVGVSFVREKYLPEDIPQPEMKGRLLANDEVYMDYQKVHSVAIGGPYGSTTVADDTPSRDHIFSCHPDEGAEAEACAREILSRIGRRAYRRPVTDGDLRTLMEFFDRGRAENGGSFDHGIQMALEFLLSDPEFLLRVRRDPPDAAPGEKYRLSDRELATRLAFFLWSTLPDDELLDLAERGELSDPRVLEDQVLRMLDDPRATEALVEDFAAQWLNLRRLDEVKVNTAVYPEYDETLLKDFRRETQMFVTSTLREDRSVLDLLTADYTYANERLSRHYGIPGVYGSRMRRVEVPDPTTRGGLLTHGSLMAVTSYPGRTSPVLRGKWLLGNILAAPPSPPPPNVPLLPENEEGERPRSIRERLAQHRNQPVCAQCHTVIDPPGFALQKYDVIGGLRSRDEMGIEIEARGTLPSGRVLEGVNGLKGWILDPPDRFPRTVTQKLMAYALGRRVEYYDKPAVRKIVREAADDDYSWSSIVLGVVNSPGFLMRRATPVAAADDE